MKKYGKTGVLVLAVSLLLLPLSVLSESLPSTPEQQPALYARTTVKSNGEAELSEANVDVPPVPFAQGDCGDKGDNVRWTLDENGTLKIYGTGNMKAYNLSSVPWNGYTDLIKQVIVLDGVTGVGAYAFYDCGSVTRIYISKNVAEIGNDVFSGCSGLKDIYYGGTEAQWNSLTNKPQYGTVHFNSVLPETISFKIIEISVRTGNSITLDRPRFSPQNTTVDYLEWSSSDDSVATVDSKGTVTGKKTGTAIITIKTINGLRAECTVIVSAKVSDYGDANGDGEIDGKDVLLLRKYMAAYDDNTKTSSVAVQSGADANGDGNVDGKDVLLLRQYMANYDDDTGTSTVKLGSHSSGEIELPIIII